MLLLLNQCIASQTLFSSHSPVPTITWRKINGIFPKKARLRKSQAVLEIPNIQLEDSGTYECKAENTRGGTAFKGHLLVYSKSECATFTHLLFTLLYWHKNSNFVKWVCGMHYMIFFFSSTIMHYPRANTSSHVLIYLFE